MIIKANVYRGIFCYALGVINLYFYSATKSVISLLSCIGCTVIGLLIHTFHTVIKEKEHE
jgi:hypothetical protein